MECQLNNFINLSSSKKRRSEQMAKQAIMKHGNGINFSVFLMYKCMNHISISRHHGDLQSVAHSSNEVSNSCLLSEIEQFFNKVENLQEIIMKRL